MGSEQKWQKGFTLVELLLAITVFALLTGGLIGAVVYGRAATANAGDHARAVFIAQEGVAAARNIGDAAYANLTLGAHGLVQSGGIWTFSGTSDTSGMYTRVVTIASGGTNRLTIASTVTWTEPGGATGSVTETGEMTNWTAAIKLWSNATLAGSVAVTGTNAALKTDTQGNYAYTVLNTNSGNNFVVTNIATPTAPVNVASITLPSSELPTNITVNGNYAYVTLTHATATLAIINVSNPAAPSQVGTYSGTGVGDGASIFVNGTTAYFGRTANSGVAEFSILNVSNPAAPTLIGSYGNNTSIKGIYVSGNYAYLATSTTTSGLVVVNITTPSAPTLAKAFQLANTLGGTAVTGFGTNLLIGTSASTMYALNVATPTAPTTTGSFTTTGSISSIDVDITNQFAFVGNGSTTTSFQVVNIATLSAMTLAKTVTTVAATNGVSYDSSLDIVAGASANTAKQVVVFTRN